MSACPSCGHAGPVSHASIHGVMIVRTCGRCGRALETRWLPLAWLIPAVILVYAGFREWVRIG